MTNFETENCQCAWCSTKSVNYYAPKCTPATCDNGKCRATNQCIDKPEQIDIKQGARRNAYGDPENNFQRIADRWTVNLKNKGVNFIFSANDVWSFMVDMKLARLAETPGHHDSFVDIVGYTLCGAELVLKDDYQNS